MSAAPSTATGRACQKTTRSVIRRGRIRAGRRALFSSSHGEREHKAVQRTTTCRSTAAEKLSPLLLADTERLLVPRGHVMVCPGPVPQPPLHASVVTAHRFGSEKPSCAAVSVAPDAEFASTMTVFGPAKIGSVRCTAATASTRPAPETLSATPVLFNGTALLTTRSRKVVLAASIARGLPLVWSTHGAA